jgi:hypothetical protein
MLMFFGEDPLPKVDQSSDSPTFRIGTLSAWGIEPGSRAEDVVIEYFKVLVTFFRMRFYVNHFVEAYQRYAALANSVHESSEELPYTTMLAAVSDNVLNRLIKPVFDQLGDLPVERDWSDVLRDYYKSSTDEEVRADWDRARRVLKGLIPDGFLYAFSRI